MKHCVLITAYKDAKQMNRLIGRIPQEWGIFIHIDKKSPISCKDISDRAIKIERRPIYWGSFVHVEVFLDMMEMAMADKRHFDYFHLITGQDYPAIDLREADTLIEPGKIYQRAYPEKLLAKLGWGLPVLQIRHVRTMDRHEVSDLQQGTKQTVQDCPVLEDQKILSATLPHLWWIVIYVHSEKSSRSPATQ